MLKVSSSISTNTGMAFQCNIAVAVAHIVQGVTITAYGSIPIAPTAQIKPDVQELTLTAYLTLKYSSHAFSNYLIFGPP